MIQLTRLNGHRLMVNSDLIKHAESSPDTTLTLINGEKLVVLESCAEVLTRTLLYRAELLSTAWPGAETPAVAWAATRAHQTEQP